MNNGAEKLSMGEVLSALADGEGDRESAAAVTALWREDGQLRARWHGYQLIGDAMRSDELAGRGCDADFFRSFRERLEREPVVLAPQYSAEPPPPLRAPASAGSRARRWATPAAMAAGFVMVAGAVLVTRAPAPGLDQQIARQDPLPASTASAVPAALAPSAVSPGQVVAANATPPAARAPDAAVPFPGVLLRDPRMQQYFAAHQQFGGSTALGLPSAFLRNATFDTPAEAAGSR
jgi:sigma-E factor negative regulatory protein RseA